jgi:glutamine amidotransferase
MPDVEALTNGAYINNDGHGFAIVSDNEILVEHGMKSEEMITQFARLREEHPQGPALFHSRFGTHGTTGPSNCHPFRVGHDSRTVLAHNGILPSEVHPRAGDPRCDTRIAAEDFLPNDPFGSIGARRGRERMARWLGPGNKIVILTVNPRYRENAFVINEKAGVWEDGTWYSNHDYLANRSATRAQWRTWWQETEEYSQLEGEQVSCVWCGNRCDPTLWNCDGCGACPDCGDIEDWCACWESAAATG